jgi:hypothetical protein
MTVTVLLTDLQAGSMKLLHPFIAAITLSLIVVAAVHAAVYKVTDDQGNITYTDTPPAENASDEVLLPVINQLPSSMPAAAKLPESVEAEPVTAFAGYSSFALVSPLDDSLVHFDQPAVLAQLALTPELKDDHLVQFYIDGSAYGSPVAATSLSIHGLERGTHRISAHVLSSQGAVLVITASVTVHVQRHFKRN